MALEILEIPPIPPQESHVVSVFGGGCGGSPVLVGSIKPLLESAVDQRMSICSKPTWAVDWELDASPRNSRVRSLGQPFFSLSL